jgi:hypothetical protein
MPERTAVHAEPLRRERAECGGAALGMRLKGGGSGKKFGERHFGFLRLATR